MAFDSEPNAASRKTLDEIRRELDAEYGFPEAESAASPVREVSGDRSGDDTRARPRPAQRWSETERTDEELIEARLAQFRNVATRHQLAMERGREDAERRPRRAGYLVAALVGCIAGQLVLFAFLIVTRYDAVPEVLRTSVASHGELTTAAPSIPPAARQAQGSPETQPDTGDSAAVAASRSSSASSAPEETRQPATDLPPRPAQEPRSSSRPPAIVSTATARGSVPSRVAPEPREAPARMSGVVGTRDLAESQALLRTALGEWLRTSARGGAPLQTTEPVIILGSDGRSAKTYLSIASPIGLIPREQRWELRPRGWQLVDDRQAGLPRPGTARDR